MHGKKHATGTLLQINTLFLWALLCQRPLKSLKRQQLSCAQPPYGDWTHSSGSLDEPVVFDCHYCHLQTFLKRLKSNICTDWIKLVPSRPKEPRLNRDLEIKSLRFEAVERWRVVIMHALFIVMNAETRITCTTCRRMYTRRPAPGDTMSELDPAEVKGHISPES